MHFVAENGLNQRLMSVADNGETWNAPLQALVSGTLFSLETDVRRLYRQDESGCSQRLYHLEECMSLYRVYS